MNLQYDVYLSIAMHGRLGQDVIDQGQQAIVICEKLGLTYYAPWEDEKITPTRIIDLKPGMRRMRGYVKKDDAHVDKSKTLVILSGDKSSSGTLWEAGRMYYRNKRPVIVVSPRMVDGQLVNFTTVKAAKVTATPLAALKHVKKIVRK